MERSNSPHRTLSLARVNRTCKLDVTLCQRPARPQTSLHITPRYGSHSLITVTAPRVPRLLLREHAEAAAASCEQWLCRATTHSGSPSPRSVHTHTHDTSSILTAFESRVHHPPGLPQCAHLCTSSAAAVWLCSPRTHVPCHVQPSGTKNQHISHHERLWSSYIPRGVQKCQTQTLVFTCPQTLIDSHPLLLEPRSS